MINFAEATFIYHIDVKKRTPVVSLFLEPPVNEMSLARNFLDMVQLVVVLLLALPMASNRHRRILWGNSNKSQ